MNGTAKPGMTCEGALQILKVYFDQGIGQGLFKKLDDVNLMQQAMQALVVCVREKEELVLQVQELHKLKSVQ